MTTDLRERFAARLQRVWAGRGAQRRAAAAGVALRRRDRCAALAAIGAAPAPAHALPVPVVVVGNLVVGGAGKTPAVIAIVRAPARARLDAGHRLARLRRASARTKWSRSSRRARPRDVGDEPLLLARRTGAPVFVGRDRVEAGPCAAASASRGRRHRQRRRPAAPRARRATSRSASSTSAAPATAGCCRPARCASRLPSAERLLASRRSCSTTPPRRRRRCRASSASAARRDHAAARTGGAATPPSTAALDALRSRRSWPPQAWPGPKRFFAMLRERGLSISELPRSPITTTSRRCPGPPARERRRRAPRRTPSSSLPIGASRARLGRAARLRARAGVCRGLAVPAAAPAKLSYAPHGNHACLNCSSAP